MWTFIRKEFRLELRNVYGIASIFLYMVAVFYLANIGLEKADSRSWTVLYWVVVIFTCFALVLKNFTQEPSDRNLYYFTTLNPYTFILAKLMYNFLYVLVIHFSGFLVFSLFQKPPFSLWDVLILITLSAVGIASLFTFAGSIASKTKSQSILLAILGIPILIPIVMQNMQISFSLFAMAPVDTGSNNLYMVLIGVDLLIIGLLLLLFPLLWRR